MFTTLLSAKTLCNTCFSMYLLIAYYSRIWVVKISFPPSIPSSRPAISPLAPVITILLRYNTVNSLSKQQWLHIALDAYKNGCFLSIIRAALAHDVIPSTFKNKKKTIFGALFLREKKLLIIKKNWLILERIFFQCILDMEQGGLPLQLFEVRHLDQLLPASRIPLSKLIGGDSLYTTPSWAQI